MSLRPRPPTPNTPVPTVTDANLALGYLNPAYFLGGEMALDTAAAAEAIRRHCAEPLGLELAATAMGIVDIANAAMVNALRLVSIQRGYDPRDFALVAFGGAGPAHANSLAATLGIPTVVVPMSPGAFSALGLLVSDLKHDYSRTLLRRADAIDVEEVERCFVELERDGAATLAREGVATTAVSFVRQAELRYLGQSFELAITLPAQPFDQAALTATLDAFHAEHQRAYGYSVPTEPVELVNVRLTAIGAIAPPTLYTPPSTDPDPELARKGSRPAYFRERGDYVDCAVYDRYRLGVGAHVAGPAIVEEFDSTTVILPGYTAAVDQFGNLLILAAPSPNAG